MGHGYTPFELVFGKKAKISLTDEVSPVYNFDSYVKKLKFRLEYTNKKAQEYFETLKQRLSNLVVNYLDIFHSESENLSVNNFYKQKIQLKTKEPSYVNQY